MPDMTNVNTTLTRMIPISLEITGFVCLPSLTFLASALNALFLRSLKFCLLRISSIVFVFRFTSRISSFSVDNDCTAQ